MKIDLRFTTAARLLLVGVLAALICLMAAARALADAPAPGWSIYVNPGPSSFAPGDSSGDDVYNVVAYNLGGAPTTGVWTVSDTLPAGLTLDPAGAGAENSDPGVSCSSAGQTVTCTGTDQLSEGQFAAVQIPVDVSADAPSSVTDTATVSGGGAPDAQSASVQTDITSATPAFGLLPGSAGLETAIVDPDGTPATEAGAHPSALQFNFNFNTSLEPDGTVTAVAPVDQVKDLAVDLPPGLIVNPNATAVKCTEAELESNILSYGDGCPADSLIGVEDQTINLDGEGQSQLATNGASIAPIFNMVPPPGVPSEFAFDAGNAGIFEHIMGGVQTGGDYGLSSVANDITAHYQLTGVSVTLFGSVPDSSTPLLTMPSACSSSLSTSASVDSWQNPGVFSSYNSPVLDPAGNPLALGGCDQEDFTPSISVTPDTSVADSPAGLSVDLQVPQNSDDGPLAEANLKDSTVTLPAGVSINPSSANGLGACTPTEIGMSNADAPSCPDDAKIGTVEIDTPLLPDPMTGGIYVAEQNNNPFDSLLAIYATAYADGVWIKLAGHVVADPVTGQLTTTFDNNPQLPFSDFKLDFWGGPGAALTSPGQCGTYTTQSSLSPWSGTAPVTSSDPFTISSGCQTGFKPSFTAGSENAQAGAYSQFVVSFSRQDSDQFFSGLSATLPDGVVAKLAGVGECTSAELATAASKTGTEEQADPSCPSSSQVGTVEAGAGSGPDPYYLPGKVYLTGPYKGAPFGLAVVVPAVAGPYDLGTVVIRQQLQINPTTAQVTVVSDPFPTILQGIPLQVRSVRVTMNRSDFTINPTSCDVMATTGTLSSTGGLSAPVSSRFQVGGCAALGFSPKLKMSLTGKGQTKSGDHPTLTSTLTQPAGQANIHNVRVALPLNFALDPNNSQNVCPYSIASVVHGGAVNCPASTVVGHATAVTPLLSQPLSGNVYLVQGLSFKDGVETHTLPTLLIPLRGQIALDLRAQTSVSRNKLVTTFPTIPDAAVSRFTLTINGGKKGILVITGRGRSICGKPQVTDASLIAQSGKAEYPNIKMSTPCRATHKTSKHHKK